MSIDACVGLSAVFPLLLITIVLGGEQIPAKAKVKWFYTLLLSSVFVSGIGGLTVSILGLAFGGLGPIGTRFAAVSIILALASLTVWLTLVVVYQQLRWEADVRTGSVNRANARITRMRRRHHRVRR